MDQMFSLRVYRLTDYYLDEAIHTYAYKWHRLLWLEDGSGMLFLNLGNQVQVKQYSQKGWIVLFSQLFYDGFLKHYPHYSACLLFDRALTQVFIGLGLQQSHWLTLLGEQLLEAVSQGQSQECLQSYLDLLLLIAGDSYSAVKKVAINTFQAVKYREIQQLLRSNYKLQRGAGFYAEKLNMSSRALNAICKKLSGMSFSRELLEYRNAEAQRLLLFTAKSVKEIGLELGYLNQAHFAGFFKKYNKISPGVYRRK